MFNKNNSVLWVAFEPVTAWSQIWHSTYCVTMQQVNSVFVYFKNTVKSLLEALALIDPHPPVWMPKMLIFSSKFPQKSSL